MRRSRGDAGKGVHPIKPLGLPRQVSPISIDGGTTVVHLAADPSRFSEELRAVLSWPDRDRCPEERARDERVKATPFLWMASPAWLPTARTKYPVRVWRASDGRTTCIEVDGSLFIRIDETRRRVDVQLKARDLWAQGAGVDGYIRVASWAVVTLGEHLGIEIPIAGRLSDDLDAGRHILRAGSEAGWRIGNLESCGDFVGLAFDLGDLHNFVGRQGVGSHFKDLEDEDGGETTTSHSRDGRVETIDLATRKSRRSMCIYNKSAQVHAKKKGDPSMYAPVWAAWGWRGNIESLTPDCEEVLRVEARWKGEALCLESAGSDETIDLRRLEAVADPELLARAWRYHSDCMRLVLPGTATRPSRCETDPRWLAVAAAAVVPADWVSADWRCQRQSSKVSILNSVKRAEKQAKRALAIIAETCGVMPPSIPSEVDASPIAEAKYRADCLDSIHAVMVAIFENTGGADAVELGLRARAIVDAKRHHVGPELAEFEAKMKTRIRVVEQPIVGRRALLDPRWIDWWLAKPTAA